MAGGMQTNSKNGTSGTGRTGRDGRRHYRLLSEINVTPLVDVMLVLLIVFMIAAPLLTVGVPVNLPHAGARALTGDEEPLAITIKADGRIFIQDTEITDAQIVPRLRALVQENYGQRIYVRGDEDAAYGMVAQVMARINQAGFTRVALVTDMSPATNQNSNQRSNDAR